MSEEILAAIGLLNQRLDRAQGNQDDLARLVATLLPPNGALGPLTSSFDGLSEAAVADLLDWLQRVYLKFPGTQLGPCWAYHAAVLEELTALRGAHQAAFDSRDWFRVCDWMGRFRTSAVERINKELSECDLDRHVPGTHGYREQEPVVVLPDMLGLIVTARSDAQPLPVPTEEQLAMARRIAMNGARG